MKRQFTCKLFISVFAVWRVNRLVRTYGVTGGVGGERGWGEGGGSSLDTRRIRKSPKGTKDHPPTPCLAIVWPNMWTCNHHQRFVIFHGPFLLSSAPANDARLPIAAVQELEPLFLICVRCRGWNICERRSFTLSDRLVGHGTGPVFSFKMIFLFPSIELVIARHELPCNFSMIVLDTKNIRMFAVKS